MKGVKMNQLLRSAAIVSALALSSGPALSWEIATGKVIEEESSYLPTTEVFTLEVDQGGTSCATNVYWWVGPNGGSPTPESTQSVADRALVSKLLGQSVTVYTVGCAVYFFHVGY